MGIWTRIRDAMIAGHELPRATLGDQFLTQDGKTMLSRSAWVPGLGIGVKSVTAYPNNPAEYNLPTIHGSMVLFDDETGVVRGLIPSDDVTNLKTAADSILGSSILARPNSTRLLIMGAGNVAAHLVKGYAELMPHLDEVKIWNRTHSKAVELAQQLGAQGFEVEAIEDLAAAAGQADVISSATMTPAPVLMGEWIEPGTHVDLIGAFNATMREGDDALISKATLFCDCVDTTIDHIGEFLVPIQSGLISRADIVGDFYDLIPGRIGRTSETEITLFKNGGGAHLDLMTAGVVLQNSPSA